MKASAPPPSRKKRPKPKTPEQERSAAYRRKGFSRADYRYPQAAELAVETKDGKVPLLFPIVYHQSIERVSIRIKKLAETYPTASIYITISSKANTEII